MQIGDLNAARWKKVCSQSNFGSNSLNFKGSSLALLGHLSKIYIHRGSTKWFWVNSVLKQHPHFFEWGLNCHATTDNHHGHNSVHRGGVGDCRVRKRSNKVLYSLLASFLFSTCSILLDSVLNHWETTSSKISELNSILAKIARGWARSSANCCSQAVLKITERVHYNFQVELLLWKILMRKKLPLFSRI